MSHAKNKVDWCLKKAEKELKDSDKHRGLVKTSPDLNKARAHITKSEHYFRATVHLKAGNFSDISASTIFYSMYHCLLAIASKFGYESRNQECTFALIYNLIEEGKIDLSKDLLDKIHSLDVEQLTEKTSLEIREQYQYGTELSLKENLYEELLDLARKILSQTKVIIEK